MKTSYKMLEDWIDPNDKEYQSIRWWTGLFISIKYFFLGKFTDHFKDHRILDANRSIHV